MPLITVAIPTRNRPEGLRAALASALAQEGVDLEVVVSDNGASPAPVAALPPDPRVRFFKQEHDLSMVENWNFCLGKAAGEFFLLLSDDDVLLPGALQSLSAAARAEGISFSYGCARFENADHGRSGSSAPAPARETGGDFIRASLQGKRQALPSFTLVRTAAARAGGGYPDTGNSTDLALRLCLALDGDVAFVPGPAGVYRIHPASLTCDLDKMTESFSALAAWARLSPLASHEAEIKGYCAASLRRHARACVLRGDSAGADKLYTAADGIAAPGWYEPFLRSFWGSVPVRVLAALRRNVLVGLERARD
ncbi:MAG: glycosyltransferase [Elusimicrobiales bacterium]